MKVSPLEMLMLIVLATLVIVPTGPAVAPVEPVVPDPVVTGDILDQAEDEIRAALVELLGVYADEDLSDSKFFDAFSEELSREQAKAMMPVSQILYKSSDLRETAKCIADHELGVE